jgi:hypothetical protein
MNFDNNSKDIPLIITKKLRSIFSKKQELIYSLNANIYTCNHNKWLNSTISGYLCLIHDYYKKSSYLVLYEPNNLEKMFELKLFSDFPSFYYELSNDFHYVELNNSFIGFKFNNIKNAKELIKIIKLYTDDYKNKIIEKKSTKTKNNNIDAIRKNFKFSKSNFSDLKKFVNPSSFTIDVCKPLYFYLLSHFSFDSITKKFSLDTKLPQEISTLLNNIGYKKSYLKNESMSLILFKNFIESFDKDLEKQHQRLSKIVKLDDLLIDVMAQDHKKYIATMKRSSLSIMNNKGSMRKSLLLNNEILSKKLTNSNKSDIKDSVINSSQNNETKPNNDNEIKTIPKIPKVPNIPNIVNIPNIPKIPIIQNLSIIPNIPNLKDTQTSNINVDKNTTEIITTNEHNYEKEEKTENDVTNELIGTNNNSVDLSSSILSVVLKKAHKIETGHVNLPIKSLNDMEFLLKEELKKREIQMGNDDKSLPNSDSESEEWD